MLEWLKIIALHLWLLSFCVVYLGFLLKHTSSRLDNSGINLLLDMLPFNKPFLGVKYLKYCKHYFLLTLNGETTNKNKHFSLQYSWVKWFDRVQVWRCLDILDSFVCRASQFLISSISKCAICSDISDLHVS